MATTKKTSKRSRNRKFKNKIWSFLEEGKNQFALIFLFLSVIPLFLFYIRIYNVIYYYACVNFKFNQYNPPKENWGYITEVFILNFSFIVIFCCCKISSQDGIDLWEIIERGEPVIVRNVMNDEFLRGIKEEFFNEVDMGGLTVDGVRSQIGSPTFTLFNSDEEEEDGDNNDHTTPSKLSFLSPSYSHSVLSSNFSSQTR